MRATIEVDVKDHETLNLIRQTFEYLSGVGNFKLSFDDEYGNRWSRTSVGGATVAEEPRIGDSAVVTLEKLAETLETWAGNVEYNNKDEQRELWAGRAKGYRGAAAEARRLKKELLR